MNDSSKPDGRLDPLGQSPDVLLRAAHRPGPRIFLLPEPSAQIETEIVIVGTNENGWRESRAIGRFNEALDCRLVDLAAEEGFAAKRCQVASFTSLGRIPAKRVALLGLGAPGDGCERLTFAGAAVAHLARRLRARRVAFVLPATEVEAPVAVELFVRGLVTGLYEFNRHRTEKQEGPAIEEVAIVADGFSIPPHCAAAVDRGSVLGRAINWARDLVNEPANHLGPESLARAAAAWGESRGLVAQVLDPNDLARRGMNLLLGVGKGSSQGAHLVHLTYTPPGEGANAAPLVLVGKGVTFDSGGLNLKPAKAMRNMKVDMAGAAVVLAALRGVVELGARRPVHVIAALAENMPGGEALRPGDVLLSAAGKTVEVENTDAEGRLILADALSYAAELRPHCLIDVGTLSGAYSGVLGPQTAGVFSSSQPLVTALGAAAQRSGEALWRLPLVSSLRGRLRSDVADLKATVGGEAGPALAVLFLREFTGSIPWAHLDISGPCYREADDGPLPRGATGMGVATLIQLATSM